MRRFLRIARAGATPLSSHLLPRCSCARRSFHTRPALLAGRKQRVIHGGGEDSVAVAEETGIDKYDKSLAEEVEAEAAAWEDKYAFKEFEDQHESDGPLMITEDVAKVLGKPYQLLVRSREIGEARRKARWHGRKMPKLVTKKASAPPSINKFATKQMLEENAKIRAMTRRAVIEVYTHMMRPQHAKEPRSFPFGYRGDESETPKVKVTKDVVAGQFKFDYGSGKVLQAIGKGWGPTTAGEETGEVSVVENDDWTEIPIAEKELLFTVVKRVTQLCGFQLPDHCLQSISTAGDLASQMSLHRPGAPTAYGRKPKLADQLVNPELPAGAVLQELQNVRVYNKRILLTDREIAIGRLATIPLITKKPVQALGRIPSLEEVVSESEASV